jgi:hypothetical protein
MRERQGENWDWIARRAALMTGSAQKTFVRARESGGESSNALFTVAGMGPGSCGHSACALGHGSYFALVAQNQEKLASVRIRSSLSLGVLRGHALCVQGLAVHCDN